MNLLEQMKADKVRKPICTMSVILDSLGPKDRALLQEALDDPSIMHAAIARVLGRTPDPTKPDGGTFMIGGTTVGRHRNGECACSREMS